MERLISVVGMVAMVLLAYAMSYDRRRVPWRVVLWGAGLQLFFAFIILWIDAGKIAFQWAGDKVTVSLDFTQSSNFITANSE
jgi:CNT family concentrative nucleoside transporter